MAMEDMSPSERKHLIQMIETLQNLTSDYKLKYKEKEIELTNKFQQKEKVYLSKIDSLKEQLHGYSSEIQLLRIDSLKMSYSQTQSVIDQNNEYLHQIQSLKQEISHLKLL